MRTIGETCWNGEREEVSAVQPALRDARDGKKELTESLAELAEADAEESAEL